MLWGYFHRTANYLARARVKRDAKKLLRVHIYSIVQGFNKWIRYSCYEENLRIFSKCLGLPFVQSSAISLIHCTNSVPFFRWFFLCLVFCSLPSLIFLYPFIHELRTVCRYIPRRYIRYIWITFFICFFFQTNVNNHSLCETLYHASSIHYLSPNQIF